MAEQLSFELPVKPALGRDDFMVAHSNAIALAMIEATDAWENHKLVLSGPTGAGKTHLAHVWAGATGGEIIQARGLDQVNIPALATGPLVVEDVPQIAQDAAAQTALFHLHNLMQTAGHPLLLTGTSEPHHWAMSLPDLQSRIDASGVATLEAPDDTLLAAVLAKLFADRQLMPRADVIPYLILRMERSFKAARDVVGAMDEAGLARHAPLTRALAGQVLDKMA
ncbi:chromosomal replication initiator DnaA [Pseudosulfitobacter sp. SM2401]|uniref:chromosomal replication initiator DnaA n=1 Tax=Pseudosulfitobacter sp. SM2401 TaxID=3350098 RepID=UPI0036F24C27